MGHMGSHKVRIRTLLNIHVPNRMLCSCKLQRAPDVELECCVETRGSASPTMKYAWILSKPHPSPPAPVVDKSTVPGILRAGSGGVSSEDGGGQCSLKSDHVRFGFMHYCL